MLGWARASFAEVYHRSLAETVSQRLVISDFCQTGKAKEALNFTDVPTVVSGYSLGLYFRAVGQLCT